ncbi:hypothetical protein EV691_106161 [Azotobacter chroococcum]|uniref:Uncharacterized protein n=2 Tax=Azotobacter chroococcum TaxID=353 RepID=A0A4V2Q7Q8_9GAMM|nr:hypothetical protein EV691_106161 [Azotobacter chroococcum]
MSMSTPVLTHAYQQERNGGNTLRNNLELLDWFSMEQALALLQKKADSQMTMDDLASQCIQYNCAVYLKLNSITKGNYPGAFNHPSTHDLANGVYGIGYQLVEDPKSLFAHSDHGKCLLPLTGAVLVEPTTNSERIDNLQWEAEIDLTSHLPLFKKSDIQRLADEIIEASSDGPSRKSILMVMGALLEILTSPTPKRMNQDAIQKTITDTHKGKRGLGKRNVEDIFSLANKALKEAGE